MEWRKFEIIMSNDKYIQNRKIVYQCSYCGTQYVNRDNYPGYGATSAASTVLADNLDTMLTTDLEQQRTEVGKNSYLIVTGVHMLFCCTLIGLTTCPLMILVHLVYHIAKRKKPHPLVIVDSLICLTFTVLLILVILDII